LFNAQVSSLAVAPQLFRREPVEPDHMRDDGHQLALKMRRKFGDLEAVGATVPRISSQ